MEKKEKGRGGQRREGELLQYDVKRLLSGDNN